MRSLWEFWIDRGGTFTDVVITDPDRRVHTTKVLSERPSEYEDAAAHVIREWLELPDDSPVPRDTIGRVLIGTTLATNALLERKGARAGLVITRGFRDLLEIGYQDRPEIFALEIVKPESLATAIVEVDERVLANGSVRTPLDERAADEALRQLRDSGIQSLAVVLLHSYRNPEHECAIERLAAKHGFAHVSLSHRVAREIRAVPRGDTTVVDAYLTPVLRRYADRLRAALGPHVPIRFMQSAGGLVDAARFSGKDALLSGPAGGVVACRDIRNRTSFRKLIGFDMGGTSTDVSRVDEETDLAYEKRIAGVRVRAPMFRIETIAAGGGSILAFQGGRLTVGPESAGANPGPACYRLGGPATLTDANLVLGRIQPGHFPACFGPNADLPLDAKAARMALERIADEVGKATGVRMSIEETAAGFVRIANENMAAPIKQITSAQGIDVREYTLVCFGGAAAQHACAIADALDIRQVIVHEHAGVLSAYGMGLADVEHNDVAAVLALYDETIHETIERRCADLEARGLRVLREQGFTDDRIAHQRFLELRYRGVDATLTVPLERGDPRARFEAAFQRIHGYKMPEHPVEVVNVRVTSVGRSDFSLALSSIPSRWKMADRDGQEPAARPLERVPVWFEVNNGGGRARWSALETPVYDRMDECIEGPAIVRDRGTTIVVEPGWSIRTECADYHEYRVLVRRSAPPSTRTAPTSCDPIMLEIFNNAFMSIANQMGAALERTAHSVNIKERLDFSCAIFDADAELVANAHHIPVHLGSMAETVRAVLAEHGPTMRPGQVFVTNDPYCGGSHLPDITVVTPVFHADGRRVFLVASRGHHADIGGITPGSMPAFSRTLDEEGAVLRNVLLVSEERFLEREIVALLSQGPHPARNIAERLSDLRAQVAANNQGARLLRELCAKYSLEVVQAYMRHIRANAAAEMRRVLSKLPDGRFEFEDGLDCSARIRCAITIAGDRAIVDFSGTAPQLDSNLNAPPAVTIAAILYVFRTLVKNPIPLNGGCLEPIEWSIPEGCLLHPRYPAAVAGGNVETSQRVVDVLYGALGVLAAAQGTMNNLSFGTRDFGYYETICGGAGAGDGFQGASAVHTHMTNTRITDPEVLEHRYPVVLREFAIRRGSGGAGRWRGGDGVTRSIEFREPMHVTLLTERRTTRPFGLRGGAAGQPGQNLLIRDGATQPLPGHAAIDVQPGDILTIHTPGGGGFGAESFTA